MANRLSALDDEFSHIERQPLLQRILQNFDIVNRYSAVRKLLLGLEKWRFSGFPLASYR